MDCHLTVRESIHAHTSRSNDLQRTAVLGTFRVVHGKIKSTTIHVVCRGRPCRMNDRSRYFTSIIFKHPLFLSLGSFGWAALLVEHVRATVSAVGRLGICSVLPLANTIHMGICTLT